jgi:hypothetical protein
MAFRKRLLNRMRTTGNRAKKTRLYVIENGKWVACNASALMELLSTGVRTAAGSVRLVHEMQRLILLMELRIMRLQITNV